MTTYTFDEVRAASLSWFDGDDLASSVWVTKYALQDNDLAYLEKTPSDMFKRLATEFARIEANYPNPMSYEEIYGLLSGFDAITGKECFGDVVPQGSPMSGVGNKYKLQSLSNCFVIPSAYDSYSGILHTDEEQVSIMKRRGGVGHDISTIRPRGERTANAAGTTDGIGIFMERFSNSCREVAQGGRRGALMLSIDVRHPDIETFIEIKRDRTKVTGANISIRLNDEFMHAVENDSDFTLHWPCNKPVSEAKVTKVVRATDLWSKIISAAHDNAEPGLLFWDNILKNGPADAYPEFRSVSTNPCLTGETKVAVADGRGYVSIKELADVGVDVPVYACDDDGKIVIRTMRNPRVTGYGKPVYKVTVESGHSFRATGNHKVLLSSGEYVEIEKLSIGSSLHLLTKLEAKFSEVMPSLKATQSQDYLWLKNSNSKQFKIEHRMIWESQHGKVPHRHVIHHIDFNAKNNAIENLQCMTHEAHNKLHTQNMLGDKNPMRRAQSEWSEKKWQAYHDNMSASTSGLVNGNAYDVSNEELYEHLKKLTQQLGRRVSKSEWYEYSKQHELPFFLTEFRTGGVDLFMKAVRELGIRDELCELDPRMARRWLEAEDQGYTCRFHTNELEVLRKCEWCEDDYWANYDQREVSFCSRSCSLLHANRRMGKNEQRAKSITKMHAKKNEQTRKQQLDVFTKLRFELMRDPLQKEWYQTCLSQNVPGRLGTKNGFSWTQLKEVAQTHNHRVVSVEFDGYETVYNGTVDDYHNFYFGEFIEIDANTNKIVCSFNNLQCGEIPLSPYDSCRLLLLNLNRFVQQNPFTSKAKFDLQRFDQVAQKAQRLMDDLVDLEIECVDMIIQKIKDDPEPDHVKRTELELWQNIRNAGARGRRTGLGITGLGDAMAACGIKYGSDESVEWVENAYKALAVAAYTSSVQMAEERGAFPAHNSYVDDDHPFLNRVLYAADEKLNLPGRHQCYGRRNIALTTTAPAGSVSLLTQTTSGCEPVFRTDYTRRKKVNPNDLTAQVDFTDELGDKWTHFKVYHHGVSQWMKVTGETDITKSPYFGATSDDVNWARRVDLQAAAQRWICHSISSTINLPKETSIETVKEIYLRGWKSGCKGLTIYRDGSRAGVMITEEKKPTIALDAIVDTNAPKRPKILPCDIHHATIRGEKYVVLVGLLNGRPYEVFAGLSKYVEVPKKLKSGFMIKNGKNSEGVSTYNLQLPAGDDDFFVIKDVVNQFDNQNYGAFSRIISTSLRHGTPVNFLCDQLRKDKHSDITSFAAVIARVLSKNYVSDGVVTGKKCDECGSTDLKRENGCVSCVSCGSSKCG